MLLFLCIAIYGWARRKRRLTIVGLVAIFLISWPPTAWLALQPLEHGYPMTPPDVQDAGAVVVLSSSVLPARGGRPEPAVGGDTFERCACAAWLYQHRKPLPLLVSGGGSAEEPAPAAPMMRQALIALGVPESMIWLEDRSHSTYENAAYSTEILRHKSIRRIVLVTEAYHMPRSERCFRKQGLSVIPAPCGAHTLMPPMLATFIPDGAAIVDNERALHEYLGLAWYKLQGRI